ncbi:phospholipase D family protein [Rhizobium laguerreae]|uniref:phospholipase D family protein n=1 Tax=Rhizobium laguerreae TaxID=1076926 RepID=UPI001039D636|nr:phospholipase D family protein [Rhizobium laguerreae]TBY07330.1 hypothetical protein E0I94_20995 [Rhizobium laguerreae]
MTIVTGPELFDEIKAAIGKSKSVRLAVAFWGGGAVEAMGLSESHKIEVLCNLEMGGTNPDEIEQIIRLGADVRAHKTLHAKMGVAGDWGFVGSSNASANGLGLQGREARGWEELNVLFKTRDDIHRLNAEFERFRDSAGPPLEIGCEALLDARRLWRVRKTRQETDPHVRRPSLMHMLKSDPESLRGGFAYIVISLPVVGVAAAKLSAAEAAVQGEHGKDFSVYLNWIDLPENAFLIDFTADGREITYNGIWKREPLLDPEDSTTQVCRKIGPRDAFPTMELAELKVWRGIVDDYWRSLPTSEHSAQAIDVYEFAKSWIASDTVGR